MEDGETGILRIMKQWVKIIRDLAWYKIFVVLVILLSAITVMLLVPESLEEAWNIFAFMLILAITLAALFTFGIKKPRAFGILLAVLIPSYIYFTEVYLVDELTFQLPENAGAVTLYRTVTHPFLAEYNREYRFESSNGKVIETEIGPNTGVAYPH